MCSCRKGGRGGERLCRGLGARLGLVLSARQYSQDIVYQLSCLASGGKSMVDLMSLNLTFSLARSLDLIETSDRPSVSSSEISATGSSTLFVTLRPCYASSR